MAKVNHGPFASFSVKGAQKRTKAEFIKKHSKNISFAGMPDEVIAQKLGAIWEEANPKKATAAPAKTEQKPKPETDPVKA